MSTLTNLRVFGNVLLIMGQYILLFHSRQLGLITFLCASSLCLPFFLKEKQWDVVFVIAVGMSLNLAGLLHPYSFPP